jgi:hypothetical protein
MQFPAAQAFAAPYRQGPQSASPPKAQSQKAELKAERQKLQFLTAQQQVPQPASQPSAHLA